MVGNQSRLSMVSGWMAGKILGEGASRSKVQSDGSTPISVLEGSHEEHTDLANQCKESSGRRLICRNDYHASFRGVSVL